MDIGVRIVIDEGNISNSRRYRLHMKLKHNFERSDYNETSQMWGRIMVTDEKGFKTFWK